MELENLLANSLLLKARQGGCGPRRAAPGRPARTPRPPASGPRPALASPDPFPSPALPAPAARRVAPAPGGGDLSRGEEAGLRERRRSGARLRSFKDRDPCNRPGGPLPLVFLVSFQQRSAVRRVRCRTTW